MRIVECLAPFVGSWQGVHRQRLLPTDDYQASAASALVGVTARDFATIAYTWSDGDDPQDGLMLLSGTSDVGLMAVWADSFHSAPAWMTFAGSIDDAGVIRLIGSYPAPPGPDWGWHIHIEPGDGTGGRITMHNVLPGEDPYQVVETTFRNQ
jgi:Protein of unknown function (DUF1579)